MNADAFQIGAGGAGPDLRPRTADGWTSGVALAFGVHLMLVAALALGVRWKMTNPEAVEAEVWAEIPRAAAPEAPPPAPVEPPKVEPTPAEPQPEPPKAAEPEPPVPQPVPDVVVERTPKKEPKKRKHKQAVEVFETEPPKPPKKAEKTIEKPQPKPVVPPAPAKPVPPESKANPKVDNAKAAAEREAQRNAALQRMMSDLGSLGTSSRSAGPSASYGGRIRARIKPNIVFADEVAGNPKAVVEVRCAPDGRIIARKLIEPSGVASWDDAVLRAIDRTEVLPPDENGRVPGVMQIEFKPKDF